MGTSFFIGQYFPFQGDHPHAYGDKAICSAYLHGGIGSSPRVWGQEERRVHRGSQDRIIPTRMGTSSTNGLLAAWNTDHPHAYGDKYLSPCICKGWVGSSPRVWGQGVIVGRVVKPCGIIPTRMGTRRAESTPRKSR